MSATSGSSRRSLRERLKSLSRGRSLDRSRKGILQNNYRSPGKARSEEGFCDYPLPQQGTHHAETEGNYYTEDPNEFTHTNEGGYGDEYHRTQTPPTRSGMTSQQHGSRFMDTKNDFRAIDPRNEGKQYLGPQENRVREENRNQQGRNRNINKQRERRSRSKKRERRKKRSSTTSRSGESRSRERRKKRSRSRGRRRRNPSKTSGSSGSTRSRRSTSTRSSRSPARSRRRTARRRRRTTSRDEIDRIIRRIRKRDQQETSKFKLPRVKVKRDVFSREGADETEVKRATNAMQRLMPVKANEKEPESIRTLLQRAIEVRDRFKLSDQQISSLMVERAEGALKTKLNKDLNRGIPIDSSFHEVQQMFPGYSQNKLIVERKIKNFSETVNGVRETAKQLLELVRELALFEKDPEEREEIEAEVYRSTMVSLLPEEIAQQVTIDLERLDDYTPRKINEVVFKYESAIDKEWKTNKKKVGKVAGLGPDFLSGNAMPNDLSEQMKTQNQLENEINKQKQKVGELSVEIEIKKHQVTLEAEVARLRDEKEQLQKETDRLERQKISVANDDVKMSNRIQNNYTPAFARWFEGRCPKCAKRGHLGGETCPYGENPSSFEECPLCQNGFHLQKHCKGIMRQEDRLCGGCGSTEHSLRTCPQKNMSTIQCYGCGQKGHIRADCPMASKGMGCLNCGRKNHETENCWGKDGRNYYEQRPRTRTTPLYPPAAAARPYYPTPHCMFCGRNNHYAANCFERIVQEEKRTQGGRKEINWEGQKEPNQQIRPEPFLGYPETRTDREIGNYWQQSNRGRNEQGMRRNWDNARGRRENPAYFPRATNVIRGQEPAGFNTVTTSRFDQNNRANNMRGGWNQNRGQRGWNQGRGNEARSPRDRLYQPYEQTLNNHQNLLQNPHLLPNVGRNPNLNGERGQVQDSRYVSKN